MPDGVDGKGRPQSSGIWIPYAILGTLVSIVIFVITFIGSVRVAEHRLTGMEERIKVLEHRLDDALVERRQLDNRLTRLESRQGEER